MDLQELLEKTTDTNFLREMIGFMMLLAQTACIPSSRSGSIAQPQWPELGYERRMSDPREVGIMAQFLGHERNPMRG